MKLARRPIEQFIGNHSFGAFWQRHLRWGRIRKSHAPLAFLAEPVFSAFGAGAMGAIALQDQLAWPVFLALHLAAWSACDLLVSARLGGSTSWHAPLVWLLREALALPLWLATAAGCTVTWRNHRLRLRRGGVVEPVGVPMPGWNPAAALR